MHVRVWFHRTRYESQDGIDELWRKPSSGNGSQNVRKNEDEEEDAFFCHMRCILYQREILTFLFPRAKEERKKVATPRGGGRLNFNSIGMETLRGKLNLSDYSTVRPSTQGSMIT